MKREILTTKPTQSQQTDANVAMRNRIYVWKQTAK